jgi:hypothetical protein
VDNGHQEEGEFGVEEKQDSQNSVFQDIWLY